MVADAPGPAHRRVQLVVNPAAGGGRGARLLPAVERVLRQAGHDLLTTPTRSIGHARELAVEAVAAGRVVAAMGGDGLLGAVAGAVAGAGGLLAALPAGRGNDFCRAVGLPGSALAACAVLGQRREQAVDVGVVTSAAGTTAFLGIASVGIDSDAQERVLAGRHSGGRAVYAVAAVRSLAHYRPATFAGELDGRPFRVRGWSAAVANTGVYGGGMRLAPAASVRDGLLDLVTIGRLSRPAFLLLLPTVLTGQHVRHPSVQVRAGRVVTLSADRPFRVFADGDPVGVLPCTVSVRPGALRLLLP